MFQILVMYYQNKVKKNFIKLKNILEDFNILYQEDPFLVRGLDYYSNTIFEFTLKNDSKFAILAGGNYDNLVAELGGPKLSGTGWAAGVERLKSLVKLKNQKNKNNFNYSYAIRIFNYCL